MTETQEPLVEPLHSSARSFVGSIAIVTGAGRGIGRAISLALGGAGANVALVARSMDQLGAVADEIRYDGGLASAFPRDVTEEGAINLLVESVEQDLGPISVLVNAAGVSPTYTRAERISEPDFDTIMATNMKAPFLLCQAVGKRMLDRGSGSITNISSIGGIVALPRLAAYCAAKAGLISMTRVMAVEWADRGVRVNAVAPAYSPTAMADSLITHPTIGPALLAQTPLGRFAKPDEIARAVMFVASDDASYITGQTIVVDGGWTAH